MITTVRKHVKKVSDASMTRPYLFKVFIQNSLPESVGTSFPIRDINKSMLVQYSSEILPYFNDYEQGSGET